MSLEHAALPRGEGVEDVLDLVAQHGQRGRVGGRDRLLVLDEVAEVGILLLTDRCLQGDRVLGDLDDLPHPLGGDAHLLGDLVVGRLAAQLLEQPAGDADELVDRLHHVDRDPDRPGLVGDRPRDRLPDPPGGVGGELVALVVVELLDRPDKAHVALLDQVQEAHPAADVLLGDRDHQPEVGLGQPLLRLVRAVEALGEGFLRPPVGGEAVDVRRRHRLHHLFDDGVERDRDRRTVAARDRVERPVDPLRLLAVLLVDLGAAPENRQLLEVLAEQGLAQPAAIGLGRLGQLDDRLGEGLVDQPQVAEGILLGNRQLAERVVRPAGLDRLGQLDLVGGGQEGDPADLLEVHPDRVVERDRVHHLDVDQELVVDLLDLFEVLVAVGDLDPDLFEGVEDTEDLLGLRLHLGEGAHHVVGS